MASRKPEETLTALAIVLKDGSHRLSVPTWAQLEYVQEHGYPVGVFARSTDRLQDVVAEVIREASIAAMMTIAPEDPADKRSVWTPEQAVDAIASVNPKFGVIVDYGSVRTHLVALLIASEPAEGWTDAKVAAVMVPADAYKYVKALTTLFDAAFPEAEGDGSGED